MRRVYRHHYHPRRLPPRARIPGFCCGLPLMGCCLVWAVFWLVLLVSILSVLGHLI
ncbi:MAG TPA: hypothetical protein VMV12_06200 [Candidatus Micrarchaeaceae archaeon]|nr:hypothetical protein [Candidatus Micrarchaeaceae archaeon]